MEILDKRNGIRMIEIFSSGKLWLSIRDKVAQILNVYPTALHLQYRFSTDPKALPCDLTSQLMFETMISLLWPLVVPHKLANGRRSTCAMKPVTVQVFNKDDQQGTQGPNKNKASFI
jgi:hypothetical protein